MFRSSGDINRVPMEVAATPPPPAKKRKAVTKAYTCDICSEGWSSETEVYLHRRSAHMKLTNKLLESAKRQPVCRICITKKKTDNDLIRHFKSYHLLSSQDADRIEREIFVCGLCYQIFFNKTMLTIHITRHHKATSLKIFQCPRCFKRVRSASLWCHFMFHNIISVSVCSICLKKCVDRTDLLKHIDTHQGYYHCDTCNFTAKKTVFEHHVKRHRCNYAMDIKYEETDTDRDISRFFVHSLEDNLWKFEKFNIFKGLSLPNPFSVCVLCREICTSEAEMRQHILNHEFKEQDVKKKIYVCACGEEFFNKVLLKHHIFKLKGDHIAIEPNDTPQSTEEFIIPDKTDQVEEIKIELDETPQKEESLIEIQIEMEKHLGPL